MTLSPELRALKDVRELQTDYIEGVHKMTVHNTRSKKTKSEFIKWMGPLLDCLRALGGAAKPREVSDWIAEKLNVPESQQTETLKSGDERFHNQVAWARQYLVWEGLLDSSRRGIWTLSEAGWKTKLSEEDGRNLFLKWVEIHSQARRKEKNITQPEIVSPAANDETIPPDEIEEEELLSVLRSLSPSGFERVCQRLLRESGFEKVTVTGRSHDGGIDGIGILFMNPFVSFKVLFQCKRYKGTVARAEVGDFRNAMLGRADKGIIITTGKFSADAVREANRDGAPPVELVDGEKLVSMFESVSLGVKPRTVYEVDRTFFEQFRE
jgi:restriction system protein